MELSNLTLVELKSLLNEIPTEIKRREKDEKAKALKDLEALATERGFTLAELVGAATEKKIRAPIAAKYRNPKDSSVTWSGRGIKPKWVTAFIAAGGTLDQLAI